MFIHVHYPLNQNANFIHSVLKGILPISRHAHTLLIFLCYVCTRKLIINHLHYRKGNVTFHNNFIKSTFPHKYVAVTYCAWRYSLLLSSILSLRIATSADRRLSRWLSSFWTSERVCASAWVFWYLKQKVVNEESKGIKHYSKDYCDNNRRFCGLLASPDLCCGRSHQLQTFLKYFKCSLFCHFDYNTHLNILSVCKSSTCI